MPRGRPAVVQRMRIITLAIGTAFFILSFIGNSYLYNITAECCPKLPKIIESMQPSVLWHLLMKQELSRNLVLSRGNIMF